MRSLDQSPRADSHDLWAINEAAAHLKGQACTLAARHIQDGMLRLQFNREVAYYVQGIVRDVESGSRSAEDGLKAIKEENDSLLQQSKDQAKKYIGLVAGVEQVKSGFQLCTVTRGALCTLGLPTMIHGFNNIYESGVNIIENRSNAEGPIRKLYQELSLAQGGSKSKGNINYAQADINLSLYGLFRRVKKPDAWRLWYYSKRDFTRVYKSSGRISLAIETLGNLSSTDSIFEEVRKPNE